MAAVGYSEALAFLQKQQCSEGSSIYEHLTKVLSKVLRSAACILYSALRAAAAAAGKQRGPKLTHSATTPWRCRCWRRSQLTQWTY